MKSFCSKCGLPPESHYKGGRARLCAGADWVQENLPSSVSVSLSFPPAFTFLEGRVYSFLKNRIGEVCKKEDIIQAVWGPKAISDSELQKTIERIRKKIETNPHKPRYLIAIRGLGYMLQH